jgi:HD-GYP domain-containing protein (c-di-GMP phosphodiesterase class II)
MATDRPYRATLGLEFALTEIEGLAGTLLDAEVVRVCTTLFREKRLGLQTIKPS